MVMGQSEIGIDVDLDPDTPWWQTLLKVLAVVAAGVAIIAIIIATRSCSSSDSST